MSEKNIQGNSEENSNVRSRVVKSAKWTTIQSVVNMAYGPIYKILMALVISPEGFAYIAAILAVFNIGGLLNRIGFSQALIVEKDSGSRQFSTVFWIDTGTALLISVVIFFCAPWVESFYELEKLKGMIFLVAPCILVTGMTRTFRCYMQKELRHDTTVKIDILTTFLDSSMSILFILITKSMIGYVMGTLLSRMVALACFVYSAFRQGYRMGFYFDVGFLKKIKGFSTSVTLRNIMDYVVSIADELIIARMFTDKSILGMYFFAKDLIAKPQGVISSAVSQIGLSTLAKFSDDLHKVAMLFLKMTKYLATASFPVFLGLALTSSEFVPALFGSEYAGAILYMCCFCVNSMFSTITAAPGSAALYTVKKAGALLKIDALCNGVYLILLLALGKFGVIYIVIAKMVSMAMSVSIVNTASRNNLNISITEFISSIRVQIIATLFMSAGVVVVKLAMPESFGVWPELIASIVVGGILYCVVILKKEKGMLKDVLSIVKGR